jgi:hypothetical protein
MTMAGDAPSSDGDVLALEHAVNGVPLLEDSTAAVDSAAPAGGRRRRRDRGGQHRSPERWRTIGHHAILLDRRARLEVLAGSLIGSGCLVLASRLLPGDASPFAAPSGTVGWIALIAGFAGIWLVPGVWLSAVMMRTGTGPVARLATRIGTTLAWYALVGPVIHASAQEALVTPRGIVGTTVAATAAVSLGVALGLFRHPANPTLRILMAWLVGGICAQWAIWLWLQFFTNGVDYQHIRRLDFLIVLACALLTAIGTHSRPDLPLSRTSRRIRTVLIFLAVVAVTAVALVATGSRWSPAQRMPSAIAAEQVAAPPGADVAIALTAIGPEGPGLIPRAVFTASDDTGRPVPVRTQLAEDGTADLATLLVMVDPEGRPELCGFTIDGSERGWFRGSALGPPVKLTLRDQTSGVVIQAVMPDGWCAR